MPKHTGIRLVEHFSALKAPRIERSQEHLLIEVVTLALCAVIWGADDWVEVAAVGRGKEERTCRTQFRYVAP